MVHILIALVAMVPPNYTAQTKYIQKGKTTQRAQKEERNLIYDQYTHNSKTMQ